MLGVFNSNVTTKFVKLHYVSSQNIGGTKDIVSLLVVGDNMSPRPWSSVPEYITKTLPASLYLCYTLFGLKKSKSYNEASDGFPRSLMLVNYQMYKFAPQEKHGEFAAQMWIYSVVTNARSSHLRWGVRRGLHILMWRRAFKLSIKQLAVLKLKSTSFCSPFSACILQQNVCYLCLALSIGEIANCRYFVNYTLQQQTFLMRFCVLCRFTFYFIDSLDQHQIVNYFVAKMLFLW